MIARTFTLQALITLICLVKSGAGLPKTKTSHTSIQQSNERRTTFDASHSVPLVQDPENRYPYAYYGKATIGDSGGGNERTFMTRFDTSAGSNFIVPGKRCIPLVGCPGETSSKYAETGRVVGREINTDLLTVTSITSRFGTDMYEDEVEVAGLNVPDMKFLSATEAVNAPVFDGNTAAVMGLGPPLPEHDPAYAIPSFFERLVDDRELRASGSNEISFFFGRESAATQDLSEMNLGGRNPQLFTGETHTIDTASDPGEDPFGWEIPIETVVVDNVPIGGHAQGLAVLDTGSPLIVLPIERAQDIFSRIAGSFVVVVSATYQPATPQPFARIPDDFIKWAYPCTQPPPVLAFQLGDQGPPVNFDMDPEDFSLGEIPRDDESFRDLGSQTHLSDARAQRLRICLSSVVGKFPFDGPGASEEYSLGTSFLKSWYSTYSLAAPMSITLARAIKHPPETSTDSGSVETS